MSRGSNSPETVSASSINGQPERISADSFASSRQYFDATVDGARVIVGPGIASMSDADTVEMYNEIVDAQWGLLQQWNKTVVEEPPREKQIDYHEGGDQWAPSRIGGRRNIGCGGWPIGSDADRDCAARGRRF